MNTDATSPEMTPEELVEAIESGREIHILDVRAPHRLALGRIDIVPTDHFHNIKGSELLGFDDVHQSNLDPDTQLAVVCGLGNDSKRIAKYLNDNGYDAVSLAGGMSAWMRATVPRELPAPEALDHLIQFDRVGKGALAYLLVSDGEALVVDPPRNTVHLLEAIDRFGAKLVGVADTHAHADYISGAHSLAVISDVPYYLHPSDAVYPYDGTPGKIEHKDVYNGTRIKVGRCDVEVLHTPGHTEGSVTYRAGDAFALTGDFLFVHSVGRPDLGGKTEEWTQVLWQSLATAKENWPQSVQIYPAHYGGPNERRPDNTVGATFSELRSINEPFAIDNAEAFVDWVRSRAGSFPEVYKRIKAINVGLERVDDVEAEELEAGRNECALG